MIGQTGLFSAPEPTNFPTDDRRLVKPQHLEAFSRWIAQAPELFLDYETDGLDTWQGHKPFLAGFFAPDKGPKLAELRYLGDQGRAAVRDGLKARTGRTIVFNAQFETSHTRTFGVELGGSLWDCMAAAFAINERRESYGKFGPLTQKALTKHDLGKEPIFAKAVDQWMATNLGPQQQKHYHRLPAELLIPYSCEDLEMGWQLYQKYKPLIALNGQDELIRVDSELGRVLSDITDRGMAIDLEYAHKLKDDLLEKQKQAYQALRKASGRDIDPESHQAMFGLLFGTFELPMHADLEKDGSIDDDVLSWMLTLPEVKSDPRKSGTIESLRDYRELSRLTGTYLMPWLYEFQKDGVLHANLNPYGARTRRFSSANPNLQNVPTRSELGKLLRKIFVSRLGFETYSADYSQIQYRVFIHYCREPALMHGYRTDPNFDVHNQVAKLVSLIRDDAKHINFGILFGMGKDKLARKLKKTKQEAQQILARYYAKLPTIEQLKRKLEAEIRGKGYIRNQFGGRAHLPRPEAYKAINYLCQGTERDLIAAGMVAISPLIRDAGGHTLLTIHDDVIFELPGAREDHRELLREVKGRLEAFPQFTVPIRAAFKRFARTWGEQESITVEG